MTPLAWLLLGDEIYGLRQAIRNLLLGIRPLVGDDAIRLIALKDGPFAQEVREDGFRVDILDVPSPPLAGIRNRFDKVRAPTDALWNATVLTRELTRDLRADTPQLLNVVWPALLPSTTVAARRAGTRVAWHEMNNVGSYPLEINKRILATLLRRCNGVALPCSAFIERELGPSFVSHELPLAANVELFTPPTAQRRAAARELFGINDDAFAVGVVARLDPPKGQHLVIDALTEPGCEDVVAVIAGGDVDGEYGRGLVAQAAERGLAGRVIFTGPVAAPELVYDGLDVVLNTRTDPEPLGLSVIEAILMELPVIAHDLGGPGATLRDTGGGVLLSKLSPGTIASAITGLRRGVPSLDMAAARQAAADKFAIPAVAKRFLVCTSAAGVAL